MRRLARTLSWWAKDYAFAVRRQVRGTLRRRGARELGSGSLRPVVLLPGVWEPWGFLGSLGDTLHAAGHPVHVVPGLGRNGRPVADVARDVARLLQARDLRDVVLVAHSKGGLVGKCVMADLDPQRRVTHLVAVCTPFAGSAYARHLPSRTLRAFSPDNPTLRRLHERTDVNARITTITGVFDPHIPARVALPGATNVVLDDGGHFRLLDHPEVRAIVLDVASRAATTGP
ncbi:esterase/lipase family protein [Xylanimonas protaetiae]|uniref:Alpha/beta hydrolase n=1 Tax=Xylanimonas protaetiae TaxID=2509457 RepID=A0A4P6F9U4_9MICO|nr:alpha/beta hydrolase [Xylanimonas protaetiae]QAY71049.1 alpha/beta hydrolase [Xylanimonas protaetiae]